jgi:hypothetical protein
VPYSAEISRANPFCVVLLIDQSRAMLKPMAGSARSRAEAAADAVNRWLYALVLRCTGGTEVLDRFHVGLVGYGQSVGPAFPPRLAGRQLVPIGELARSHARVEQRSGEGGQSARFPIWVEPTGDGPAPLCAALDQAVGLLVRFLTDYPDCYPPWVVNVTSGASTDGDPAEGAHAIRSLSSSDGDALLFNLHLTSQPGPTVEFPDAEGGLPGEKARRFFRLSSPLPPGLLAAARAEGAVVSSSTRGFVLNGDMARAVKWLDIGTRVGLRADAEKAEKPSRPRQSIPPPPLPVPRPAPVLPQASLSPQLLYDVHCRLGENLKTYTAVRILGLVDRATVPGGALFEPCLVLELADGRKAYLPAQAAVAIEESPS